MIALHPALRVGLMTAVLAVAGCGTNPMMASSSTASYVATLSAAAEVPPNPSAGSGSLDAKLDKTTGVLSWTLTYAGLSGPATAAHFHGPAAPGSNAGVVVPLANPASPIQGQATLSAGQIADLSAGNWYVNVHTAAHPGGEIRGQVTAK